MDIERKAGRRFTDIESLKAYIKRCDTCYEMASPRAKAVIYVCPFCLEKSLFTYGNNTYYECMNNECLNYHVKIAYRQRFILQVQIENPNNE